MYNSKTVPQSWRNCWDVKTYIVHRSSKTRMETSPAVSLCTMHLRTIGHNPCGQKTNGELQRQTTITGQKLRHDFSNRLRPPSDSLCQQKPGWQRCKGQKEQGCHPRVCVLHVARRGDGSKSCILCLADLRQMRVSMCLLDLGETLRQVPLSDMDCLKAGLAVNMNLGEGSDVPRDILWYTRRIRSEGVIVETVSFSGPFFFIPRAARCIHLRDRCSEAASLSWVYPSNRPQKKEVYTLLQPDSSVVDHIPVKDQVSKLFSSTAEIQGMKASSGETPFCIICTIDRRYLGRVCLMLRYTSHTPEADCR